MGFFRFCFEYWDGPRWATWTASWCNSVTEYNVVCGLVTQQLPEFQHISGIFSKILTSSTPTWTFSSQTIPMVKVRCLHRLEGVIYCYESVPVPPMPPGIPTRNPVVPVCHMTQELYIMVDLCVLLFMWWPRGCGWNSRLSLQSIDYPCSLRLHCICKNLTKY